MAISQDEVLLTDEQVRRFVTDGYLVLNANVAPEIHQTIYERLQWVMHQESNPGNNVLPFMLSVDGQPNIEFLIMVCWSVSREAQISKSCPVCRMYNR